MDGQITALKVQKRNKRRVTVYLDGKFAFGLADIEAARLQVGQTLSDQEIARLQERDSVEVALQRGMDLLSYRPRSRGELRTRLRKKGLEEAAIAEALDRLERTGLLNDLEFAHYWIENRFQFNPRGAMALRQELRQKGLDQATIDQALADYDEEKAAARAAERAVQKLSHLNGETFQRKLSGYLKRRGFSYSIVRPLVEVALANHGPGEPFGRDEE